MKKRDLPFEMRETETWIFDLDNTLYPASINLFSQIDVRMRVYIAEFLGLEQDDAFKVQKQYFRDYGTSLRGMMDRHGMDPAGFLDHVHDIDLSILEADPLLDQALARLPGRKLIFTNACTAHAERVTRQLGIDHHFEAVFDVVAAEYRPKPEPATYHALVDRHGVDPKSTVMVEDLARNLEPAAALGMTTVWVRTNADIGVPSAEADYIDYVLDDLTTSLTELTSPGPEPSSSGTG
jgi:putative hydrolase of the HAD superfamily